MTKKLSLAAVALISACYFTACDDSASASGSDESKQETSGKTDGGKTDGSITANCDINYDSDKWSFNAKGSHDGMNVSVDAKTEFAGKTATTTLNLVMELGDKSTCEMYKTLLSGDFALPEGVELPEGAIEEAEEKVDIKAECDDKGTLTQIVTEVEENVTEESKKEAYDEIVESCKEAKSGNLSSFFDDGEEE